MSDKAITLAENFSVKPQEIKSNIGENQIFVGAKPFMRYVRTAEILLRNKNLKLISIRGRGMMIGKAVDLAEAIRHKFCADLKLNSSIQTYTEKFTKDDKEFSVSVIEVNLMRKI
jgi:DNA-binding protein Alba